MNVIENENPVGIDIDNTLLMWDDATKPGLNKLEINYGGGTVYLTPHNYHIAIVRSWHERGYQLVFWSANGYNHARNAVKALGLDDLKGIIVMTKLTKHLDDSTNPGSILGPRVYEEDFLRDDTSVSQ